MTTTVTVPQKGARQPQAAVRVMRPRVDLIERSDEWLLVFDVPGVDPESIELSTEKGLLRLRADRQALPEVSQEDARWLVRERAAGRYEAVFQVREGIDLPRISAEASNGVLRVRLPKSEALQPHKIAVRSK